MPRGSRFKDKWRTKKWYSVQAPEYFGNMKIASIPSDDPKKLIGRIIESTLYDITEDFAHQYLRVRFQITSVEGRRALTTFKGHEYSRDYLRSLVRRKTSRIDGVFGVTTKDGYKLRVSACTFTVYRIKTSQQKAIRAIMKRMIEEKANSSTFVQFVQEIALQGITQPIRNETNKIAPIRHVGIIKSKLLSKPPSINRPTLNRSNDEDSTA